MTVSYLYCKLSSLFQTLNSSELNKFFLSSYYKQVTHRRDEVKQTNKKIPSSDSEVGETRRIKNNLYWVDIFLF